MAHVGRNARLIPDIDEPVHIIMERTTGKTMEVYVEFVSIQEAVAAVERYHIQQRNGKAGRIGDRYVEMEVVGHESLMRDLFSKATDVRWHGSEPEILPIDPSHGYSTGFKGFVTEEELTMLVKAVEHPQRVSLISDSRNPC